MPLRTTEVESALSFAYLNAVASMAGCSCVSTSRAVDCWGIDAHVQDSGAILEIQLKATTAVAIYHADRDAFSFPDLSIKVYDDLRVADTTAQRILVVLFLDDRRADVSWVEVTDSHLVMYGHSYWVSLRNAPASNNCFKQVIYLPKANLLTPTSLRSIMDRLLAGKKIDYGSL